MDANKSSFEKIKGAFKGLDILSLDQFDVQSVEKVFKVASELAPLRKNATPSDILKGSIATLLFYEPSSRTFGSFASAVKQLGGQTLDINNPNQTSSVVKGETLEDTIRVFESFSDVIIIRHPEAGTAMKAAKAAFFVPVINAGDGIGEHPTQALLDLYTIHNKFKRLDNLTGVLAGDLLNGRTVHSLIRGLSLYKENTLYLLSPKNLRLSDHDFKDFTNRGIKLIPIESETEIPKDAHFWYWTRVQKERFSDLAEYEKVKLRFILTPETLKKYGNKDLIIMHPLPRVGEIDEAIDSDPRAYYFKQVENGVAVRMALVALVLGKAK